MLLACFLHASLTNSSFSDKKKYSRRSSAKSLGREGGSLLLLQRLTPGKNSFPNPGRGNGGSPPRLAPGSREGRRQPGGCSPASQPEPAGGRLSLRGCGAVNRRQPALRGGQARAPTPPHPALPRPGDPRPVVRERLGRQSGRGRRRKVEAVSAVTRWSRVPPSPPPPLIAVRRVLTRRPRRAGPVCRSRSPAPAWWVPAGSGSPAAPPLIPRAGREGREGAPGATLPPSRRPPAARPAALREGGRLAEPREVQPGSLHSTLPHTLPPTPASAAARPSRRRRVPSAAREARSGCYRRADTAQGEGPAD